MKKTTILFLLLTFFALQCAFAQADCGAVDCPGVCGRFVDANGDGFCDHGQLSKASVVEVQIAEPEKKETKVKAEVKPEAAPEASVETDADATVGADAADEVEAEVETEAEPVAEKTRSPYPVFPILGGLLALYIISIILVKCNVWAKATHRKVWNVALTLTFLVSCLFGVALAIFINYNYRPQWYVDFLHWHVYVGIAMTIIAIFHALWHLNYFKTLFVKRK